MTLWKPLHGAKAALGLLAVLACIIAFGLIGWSSWTDYESAFDGARTVSRHAVRLVEEHAHRYVAAPDQALLRVIDRLGSRPVSAVDEQDWTAIKGIMGDLPQVAGLVIFDADGWSALSTREWPTRRENFSDRDYFEAHARRGVAGAFVGPLIKLRVQPSGYRFTVSRPILQGGRFAGVVVAIFDVAFFERFYDSLELGKDSICLILRDDGRMVVRQHAEAADLNATFENAALFSQYLPRADSGTYRGRGATDGVDRIYAYSRIDGLPLVAVAGVSVEATLANWRSRLVRNGFAGLGLLLIVLLTTSHAWTAVRRERQLAVDLALTQAGLEASEARFRAAQEASIDGFVIFEPIRAADGRITDFHWVYANPVAMQFCGITPADFGRRTLRDVLPGADQPGGLIETHAQVAETGKPRRQDLHYRDHRINAWFRNGIVRISDRYVAATFSDITGQVRARTALAEAHDAALRASEAKTRFLAAASHDLRQPFQAMRLFFQVLATGLDNPKKQAAAAKLDEAMRSGEELLGALLDISILDAGMVRLSIESFPVGEALARVAQECEPQALAKGLRLRVATSRLTVASDKVLLARMVRNLVVNAIRYTDAGGRILIGCRRVGDEVRIQVWDTGIGIPPDKLDLIFEDFYQLGNEARDRSRGLGIGLSVVARTGKLLGHSVSVASRPGVGSVFTIAIAPAGCEAAPQRQIPAPVPPTSPAPGRLQAAERAEDGAMAHIAKARRDLTGGMLAQAALAASEERMRLLLDGVTDHAIYWLDPVGNITSWNTGAERIKGYAADEVVGRSFALFYTPEDRRAGIPAAALRTAAETGRWAAEGWRLRKDGSRFWADAVIDAIRDSNGRLVGYVKITRDTTGRHHVEEAQRQATLELERRVAERTRELEAARQAAERADAAKSRFLAAASHDLRQPFQAMRLFFEILSRSVSGDAVVAAAKLEQAMRAGEELLTTLLDISMLDSGTMRVTLEPVAVGELLERIADECRPQAEEKGLRLHTVATSATTVTDRVLLARILRNLVVNAVRYTERGGIVIGCRRRGGEVLLEVWDSGIGIPPDQQAAIFEDFVRLPQAGRGHDGHGLGLAVVARMAQLLGLRLDLRSRPGKGSVFAIALPDASPAENRRTAAG